MKKPNLFIVGHPRSGTTSLYAMLKQHPEIFMSEEKGLYYFSKDLKQKVFSKDEYLSYFLGAKNEKVVGEASPEYLASKRAASEISSFNPNAKIIMILREPVDFIRALYQKKVSGGKESIKNIKKEIWKSEYIDIINYYEQIRRYLSKFPKNKIKIIIYEDYKKNNEKILREIFDFLEVRREFTPKKEKMNYAGFNRWGKLNLILKDKKFLKFKKEFRNLLPNIIRTPIKNIYRKTLYKKGQIKFPKNTKIKMKKEFKLEVEKLNRLLHRENFLPRNRDLVEEWGYRKI